MYINIYTKSVIFAHIPPIVKIFYFYREAAMIFLQETVCYYVNRMSEV